MKILKLLFLSLFVSFAISCSSSDDDNGSSGSGEIDAELVDTWIGTAVDYTGTTETEFNGVTLTADFVGEGFDIDYSINFTENPNEVTSDGSYSILLTTTIQGTSTEQTIPNLTFFETSTWEVNGDQITVSSNGAEPQTFTITELTETTLIIEGEQVTVQTQSGATVTTTVDLTAVYTRG